MLSGPLQSSQDETILIIPLHQVDRGMSLHGMTATAQEGPPLDESALGSIFSAPELGSESGYGPPVDVYSLGLVLVAVWAGAADADALVDAVEKARAAPPALPPAAEAVLPPELLALLQAMLAHEPEARPTAEWVRDVVRAAFARLDTATRREAAEGQPPGQVTTWGPQPPDVDNSRSCIAS
jgi:serine/threonine protein kinase